jgi:hypothetical protein
VPRDTSQSVISVPAAGLPMPVREAADSGDPVVPASGPGLAAAPGRSLGSAHGPPPRRPGRPRPRLPLGSLGKNDRLNIHWAATQLPVSLVDYIIVHELAHIGQPRHIPAFWAAVERVLPDYDQRRTRLAGTGTTLWLG